MSLLAFGLLGSGEFDPWAEDVDRWLLERARTGHGRVLILPTASAAEGDDVFDGWAEKGLKHYRGMGVRAEVVPLKNREDAGRPEFVAKLDDAAMVFFSGGNPAYMAATLGGTAFWLALLAALDRGLAYGGCSAGVASLAETAPDSDAREIGDDLWKPGLGLFRDVVFGPHWEMLDSWVPGARDFIVASVQPGGRLLGIDENTAVVGDGSEWAVIGAGAAHVMVDGEWQDWPVGASFTLPLTERAREGE